MTTTIALEGMEFYAHHGCFAEERRVGGRFIVDASIEADLMAAAESDNIGDTIDYSMVYQCVKAEMSLPSNLIENAACRIAKRILADFPQAQGLRVKVIKLNPALGGQTRESSASIYIRQ